MDDKLIDFHLFGDFIFDMDILFPGDPTANKERIEEYKEYYKVKYSICKIINPKVIAEIGVRAGYSAWSFLKATPNAVYYGFDANNNTHGGQGNVDFRYWKWAEKILKNFSHELIILDTQKVDYLPVVNIDLFHIDGDHSTDGVIHDLDLAYKTMRSGGFMLVDDVTHLSSVRTGVKKWLNNNESTCSWQYINSFRGECLIKV